MSLDYPFYEELRRRRHKAAKWWLIGDCLYYLGLLPAMLALPMSVLLCILCPILGWSWRYPVVAFGCFLGFAVVFLIGAELKRYSYILAGKDGIDINDY
jgi:hypothetical protein